MLVDINQLKHNLDLTNKKINQQQYTKEESWLINVMKYKAKWY